MPLRSGSLPARWRAVRLRLVPLPTCQLNSGAPAMAFASVKAGEWVVVEGQEQVRRIRSSSFAERLFCGRCGTLLAIDYDIQPETFDFSVVTLDDPDVIRPEIGRASC